MEFRGGNFSMNSVDLIDPFMLQIRPLNVLCAIVSAKVLCTLVFEDCEQPIFVNFYSAETIVENFFNDGFAYIAVANNFFFERGL